MVKRICITVLVGWMSTLSFAADEPLVLKASKDTFGRSNKRNRNNGACETLIIANAPNIRSLIAFDLSSVTNEISSAELRFRQHETAPEQVSLIVAAMVDTEQNSAWKEGIGNLGVLGQNARPGEACYAYSSFRDIPWESAAGKPVVNLADRKLWSRNIAAVNGQLWQKTRWVRVPVSDISLLETIKKTKGATITFGVWGTAGNGIYFISSRNSQWPPELHLTLKEGL